MFGRSLLIFLHGSGGKGVELRTYLEMAPLKVFQYQAFLDVCESLGIDVVTPSSEVRRYSAAGGERMNIWYDRSPLFITEGLNSEEDLEGIERSWQLIFRVIEEAESKGSYDNYFLGGFSMGGGCALHGLKRIKRLPKLRGIFTMGSFLVNRSAVFKLPPSSSTEVPDRPIIDLPPLLIMHGDSDDLIYTDWGKATSVNLHLAGYDVQFRSYPKVSHEIHEDELVDTLNWMKDILIKLNGESHGDKRLNYLESKYDDMTEELRNLEAKVLDSDNAGGDEGKRERAEEKLGEGKKDDTRINRRKEAKTESSSIPEHFPYFIEYLDHNDGLSTVSAKHQVPRVRIHFDVPSEFVPTLTSRPVLACGSMFEIQVDRPRGVRCDAITSDPEKTAIDISRRLLIRMQSGSSTLNPCSPS